MLQMQSIANPSKRKNMLVCDGLRATFGLLFLQKVVLSCFCISHSSFFCALLLLLLHPF
jgi:hypothetical protein